jgi:DNA-binding GntR family transcriptional regulator
MKSLAEKVFELVKRRILDFYYLPGVRLSDDEIATEMQTSRTPVREALNRLVELGLVEAKTNRGFKVKSFSTKEIEDLYSLRNTLECMAIRLTIEHMNSEIKASLSKALAEYEAILKFDDLEQFNVADTKFHDLIAFFSRNSALHEVLSTLWGKIQIIRRYDHIRPGSWERTHREHLNIFKFMIDGDVENAQDCMSKHINKSLDIILKLQPKQEKIS